MLLHATGASSANDLLHRFYTQEYPRPRVASFSRLADEAAQQGDAVAVDILNNAAQQLASLSASVRMQLWQKGEKVRLAYIGGALKSQILLQRFRLLVELEEDVRCSPPIYGPAAGALLEAYRSTGLYPTLRNVPEFKL
jgi:N-acetylglucosamine kinase-like BadF-type ATPase